MTSFGFSRLHIFRHGICRKLDGFLIAMRWLACGRCCLSIKLLDEVSQKIVLAPLKQFHELDAEGPVLAPKEWLHLSRSTLGLLETVDKVVRPKLIHRVQQEETPQLVEGSLAALPDLAETPA